MTAAPEGSGGPDGAAPEGSGGPDGAAPEGSALADRLRAVLADAPDVAWSVCVRCDGDVVADLRSTLVLPTASMGKVFLLLAAAEAMVSGEIDPHAALEWHEGDRVRDSGLWQYLSEQAITWESACVLVAAVSDNLAANVLLRELGLARVGAVSEQLGMPDSRMLDRLRDDRGPRHAHAPSQGTAGDLAALMERIADASSTQWPAGALARRWLALNVDLTLVAAGWELDPLSHTSHHEPGLSAGSRFPGFINKTGWDRGVRADAGSWLSGRRRWSYAVLAHRPDGRDDGIVGPMRTIGTLLVDECGWPD